MKVDYTPKKKQDPILTQRYSRTPIKKGTAAWAPTSGYTPRETVNYPSRNTGGGTAAAKQSMSYTGTSMIGVATMHKSNMVPVFNHQSAKDAASMRR